MCTESELKAIIREEHKGLKKAAKTAGISEDLYLSCFAKSFADAFKFFPKEHFYNYKQNTWIGRVYKRAVALRD